MLRKSAALPFPAGKRRADHISMMTLGRREECLRNRSEKGHLRAFACPSDAKPDPSRRLWKHSEAKPCRARPFCLYGELDGESKRKSQLNVKPAVGLQG